MTSRGMTSTKFQVGLSESARSSSKVLKPPGGGNSDIFGAAIDPTSRNVRSHMTSDLFSAASHNGNGYEMQSTPRRPQQDSHNRLFGADARGKTPPKNNLKSNIAVGDVTDNGHSPSNGQIASNAASNGLTSPASVTSSKGDGNPVTGEGYRINTDIPALNGNQTPTPFKNRIPPGGFSSGFW